MDSNEFKSSSSEDGSTWHQSVVDCMKSTGTKCLDLRLVFSERFNSKNLNIQPILNFLTDSEVTEIHVGGKLPKHKLQDLTKILSKTKIEKLNFFDSMERVEWATDDFMSLMAVLKETHITKLDLPCDLLVSLEKPQQVKKFIAHLVSSHLRTLNGQWFYILPSEKRSVLLQRIPDTNITCLDLSGLCYHYSSLKELSECLNTFIPRLQDTCITDLNLGRNNIGDSLAKAVGAVLGKSKLVKLNLLGNRLTDLGIEFLVPGLINSKISHLDLSENVFNGDNSLGHCLKNTKIRVLDLSQNPITKKRMVSGHNFLQGSAVSTLKICGHAHSKKPISLHIKKLKFSELTCLDLSQNRLEFEHVSALADVLCNSKLTQIALRCNRFSEICLSILGDSLTKSRLKYIDLSSTSRLGGPNVKRACGIASFIQKTKGSTVVSLNLSYNELGQGFNIVALAIRYGTFLELDLRYISLGKNIDSLAEQLKFTSIVKLNLNYNCIGDGGAVILANCLEETQIVQLGLSDNSITSLGAKALARVLKKTRIRQLDLSHNRIENDGLESLAEHAEDSCVTCVNVDLNYGSRELLIARVLWENRKKLKIFADLLNRTPLLTGDSNIFEFDRNFDGMDVDGFIEDGLKLYRVVAGDPFVVNSIEQDKCLLGLRSLNRFDLKQASHEYVDVFIEDCALIHQKVLDQPAVKSAVERDKGVSIFSKQILLLILEEFPRKLVSFIGRAIEAEVEQLVHLLKKTEELGLTNILELLLLNRPMFVIDKNQDILHPHVYILLHKYKHPICNLEIEPNGVTKIVEYFSSHIDLDGAAEVISLLIDSHLI